MPDNNTIKFTAIGHGELSAGIRPFREKVTITFEYDGQLTEAENREYWAEAIKNYFDCDEVINGHPAPV